MNNTNLTLLSGISGAVSVTSYFSGDDVMGWVFLLINAATLITNAAISIYRKIRDRDKDLKKDDSGESEK